MKTIQLVFPPYVREGRAYNRTPPTCPRGGHWKTLLEFTYRDGVKETVESLSPCARARLGLGPRNVIARGGATVVQLRCAGESGTRCSGAMALEPTGYDSRLQAAAARTGREARFDLAAGTTQVVRVALARATRTRLARRRKAVGRLVARLDDGRTVARMLSVFRR